MRSTLLLAALFCSVFGCTTPMVPGTDSGADAPRLPIDAPSLTDAPGARPLCVDYCEVVLARCGVAGDIAQYADAEACLAVCATSGWPDGAEGAMAGNTIACRIYHAEAAEIDPGVHCPHAGPSGGGVCVD